MKLKNLIAAFSILTLAQASADEPATLSCTAAIPKTIAEFKLAQTKATQLFGPLSSDAKNDPRLGTLRLMQNKFQTPPTREAFIEKHAEKILTTFCKEVGDYPTVCPASLLKIAAKPGIHNRSIDANASELKVCDEALGIAEKGYEISFRSCLIYDVKKKTTRREISHYIDIETVSADSLLGDVRYSPFDLSHYVQTRLKTYKDCPADMAIEIQKQVAESKQIKSVAPPATKTLKTNTGTTGSTSK